MKSSLKILIISILIILIGVSSYFIFFKREKISENLNSLTVFEKMTFSDNEKEIFDMLGELKENLLKGEEKKKLQICLNSICHLLKVFLLKSFVQKYMK